MSISSDPNDAELPTEPVHESVPVPEYSHPYPSGDIDIGDSAPRDVSPEDLECDRDP